MRGAHNAPSTRFRPRLGTSEHTVHKERTMDLTYQRDIALLTQCIRKAESDREAWKTAGLRERYLEACFLVDSLEPALFERMRRQPERPPAELELAFRS
jgi:hypothetical protein